MSHIQTFEIMKSSEIHPVPLCFPAKPPVQALRKITLTHIPQTGGKWFNYFIGQISFTEKEQIF